MRSTLTLLSRPTTSPATTTPPQPIPTIRLIEATPGISPNASIPANASRTRLPSPLAPRSDADAPRTRLIPKKSKLSLLGVGARDKDKDRNRARDFSNGSSGRGGFEIFVDSTYDPDIGDIVMVKKKKSRAGLNGLGWGALDEVTNIPSTATQKQPILRLKTQEKDKDKDKWWSIGRGRKDSKEKEKEKQKEEQEKLGTRAKSPEPNKISVESRTRFNSLDSGILLASSPATSTFNAHDGMQPSPPLTYSRSGTLTAGGFLTVPGDTGPAAASAGNSGSGSIALRAIRSVRSLARIGSWAQLKSTEEASTTKKDNMGVVEGKKKDKDKKKEGKEKKKMKKPKENEREKEPQRARMSTSSFEAGALSSASPVGKLKTVGKKQSILGLGLPMSIRMPTLRNGSTASSNRLSVESVSANANTGARTRNGSTLSSGSSLRPLSSASGTSRASSGCSVRWDEDGLETAKERRKQERETRGPRRDDKGEDADMKRKEAERRESRRSLEGRRRTLLSEVFPPVRTYPIVTVEEATADGHDEPADEIVDSGDRVSPVGTPVRRARPRPVSEQLLGKARPQGIYEDGDGVISILDAATNDLAQLINRLDLQATPGTPDMTPLGPSSFNSDSHASRDGSTKKDRIPESPLKGGLRESMASISSLRPYAQSRAKQTSHSAAGLIGQQIAPWPTLNNSISPSNAPLRPTASVTKGDSSSTPLAQSHKLRLTHKRTMTPSPAADPLPVFQPLCPARGRRVTPSTTTTATSASPTPTLRRVGRTIRAPSSLTFGSRSSSRSGSFDAGASPSPSPVFKKAEGSHVRKRSSLVPSELRGNLGSASIPIPPEAKRVLGLGGTMGEDVEDGNTEPADEPDSDIPDELQVILAGQSDEEGERFLEDTLEFSGVGAKNSPPSPGFPPAEPLPIPTLINTVPPPAATPLPVFRAQLIDDEQNPGEIDEGCHSSEDDTKKSFDFTGELKKLNESGGSDRRSFVEQLENAFRTPAKIDLRYGFKNGFLDVEIPPVPVPVPTPVPAAELAKKQSYGNGSSLAIGFDEFSASRIVDMKEPTLLPGSDSLGVSEESQDKFILNHDDSSPRLSKSQSSMGSRPSDGQLNTEFKFGGRPQEVKQQKKPLTLSDIIPPPSHCRSLSNSSTMEEDSAVLKSIFAKAVDIPPAAPRMRLNSDSSSKRQARGGPRIGANRHSRHSSELSFAGFESFEEVRRGFEFANRPAFYPPVNVSSRRAHGRHESLFSIASVSSYGFVINPGSTDPFDYGLPSLPERPLSEDLTRSMSMTVDDTFSFINRLPQRRRVDSDASSFYFRAPISSQVIQSYSRGHRRHDSALSITSQGPPVSLYNRSFVGHRRNDSSASASSVAHSYAMYGAHGGRAAWARHRQDQSIDSITSEFSAVRLGRPGLGDKMFEKCEQSMPLTSISASPPESLADERLGNRSSFDSILDNDRRSSMDDSLFDKTGQRSSMSSDSVFGDDEQHLPHGHLFDEHLVPHNQLRPLSMLSAHSIHSPMKDDDTMISVLGGGGHVRRRSVGTAFDASPCIKFEKKRKHTNIQDMAYPPAYDVDNKDSPNKARIIEMPSIMSTSSSKFGGERMIKAQHGLLARESLEESCLIADGEDLTSRGPVPVFSRPCPASRSRSSTCTSSSSGVDTPPLSCSEGSLSEGSQSSIDLSHLNIILANATHPVTTTARARARSRARGAGHRRRISHVRGSVYETIEEEKSNPPTPPHHAVVTKKSNTQVACDEVFIVDPETASVSSMWDDERGIVALRKYYALRDEAQNTVTESKIVWQDTPFSVFAVQTFYPPSHPAGMQALLEHSVQNYRPLPSELRPRRVRSRTQSRPSPYPQSRSTKSTLSPNHARPSLDNINRSFSTFNPLALQDVPINSNVVSPAPKLQALKPFSPLVGEENVLKRENAFGLAPNARPRVGSNARRTALGWSKRSNGKSSTDRKENIGQGILMTPSDNLRLNRPRPRGRPTPASQRQIRV